MWHYRPPQDARERSKVPDFGRQWPRDPGRGWPPTVQGEVTNVLPGGIDSTQLALGQPGIHDLSGDDMAVPADFTRGLSKWRLPSRGNNGRTVRRWAQPCHTPTLYPMSSSNRAAT